jgi:hypothetical protein
MMVVDSPERGFSVDPGEVGVERQTIDGTRTKDVFGYKQEFQIDMDGLDARALSWFEMAFRGALGPTLYMLDEQRINRMSAAASSARSAWAYDDPFVVTSGIKTVVANTELLLPGVLDGANVETPGPSNAWQWVTTIGATCQVGDIIPVQEGEHLVFSAYLLDAGTPGLEFTPFTASLTPLAPAGSTTVIAGTPPRRYSTYVVPAGVAAVRPLLRHPGAQTSIVTALQLEQGDTPTPWVMGVGIPRVMVKSAPMDRRKLGNYVDSKLTIVEV